eukprot:3048666-Pyramimonas_sp.AAC.1
MCPKEEVERLRGLKNEANRLRRSYRRDMMMCRCPPTKRKVTYTINHLVVDGRETEDREDWKEELD